MDKPGSQVSSLFWYLPSFFIGHTGRVQHSHLSAVYARRFASNFANSRSPAFGLSICFQESLVRLEPTTETSIVTRLTSGRYLWRNRSRIS